ncbi:crotonobetainyl-CoA:carnitine CoA-transferase CaiB-like acyl-CoA transferase [Raoultella sp. BIGb0138]|uniref:CaiB/BaiF CoA transferase family protein n=1 Tax=Raoultella sp. BIGb0138 TaxID=2485115 RepID=UPI00104349C7|nr:CaiB/BaiF CoA-transferase family protein [Raoultella sp. BIGb0138]TCW06499.1 crotonobetainyl-CoA:carnitine CoA-transferase CaiB-like acyl-CoA transferase [Raoultella sp. BIGb0138]
MLEGVKVLSFTHYLQGPSAAQMLADLGADVVKVESPKGAYERSWSGCDTYVNGVSVFFLLANRNQRGMAIDLKSESGKQIIYDLLSQYDVIIENFKPGVMDRLGLGYEEVKKVNPRIVYCSCTGYGSAGPKAKEPGQDLMAQSISGLAALNGPGSHPPMPVGTAIVDQHGAALAALGIIAAIFNREKSGKGHKVDACLLHSALDLQIEPLNYFLNGGQLTPRADSGLSSRFHQSPYGIYATRDGYISLSLTPFERLKSVFSPQALAGFTAQDQMRQRIDFDACVATEMCTKTTAEWTALFKQEGIWHAPVNEYPQVVEDEQVQFNEVFLTMDHPVAGRVRVLGHPNHYDGKPLPLRRLPPELGEHSEEVLLELGYSAEKVAELLANNVITTHQE